MILWLACASLSWAQDRLPLSLRKSVEIALAPDGNTRVAMAKEQIVAAEKKIEKAVRAGMAAVMPPEPVSNSREKSLEEAKSACRPACRKTRPSPASPG